MSPWKAYGLVRGLKAPPRRPVAPGGLHLPGDGKDLFFALDRTGTGDDTDVSATDLQVACGNDGRFWLGFEAGDLVRSQNRNDLIDFVVRFEGFPLTIPLFTDGRDHGPFRSLDDVGFQAHFFDPTDHVGDGSFRRSTFHHDDHRFGTSDL